VTVLVARKLYSESITPKELLSPIWRAVVKGSGPCVWKLEPRKSLAECVWSALVSRSRTLGLGAEVVNPARGWTHVWKGLGEGWARACEREETQAEGSRFCESPLRNRFGRALPLLLTPEGARSGRRRG
jgi:hypothetical protein